MRKFKVIDLFSGCGGLTEGFEQTALFRTVACVEWNKAACSTLIKRLREKWGYKNAEKIVLKFDIQRTEELLKGWNNDPVYCSGPGLGSIIPKNSKVDLIIGGPPCQAYSIAGRIRDEHGMHYDYRNYLFESYLRVVRSYKPPVVVFENVPGILSACPGGDSIIDRITNGFKKAGYEITHNLREKALLDFVRFGVPQRRSRVIIVGLKRSAFKSNRQKLLSEFYDRILPKYYSAKVNTVHEAIGDLPPFFPAKSDYVIGKKKFSHKPYKSSVSNHNPRYHNRRDIKIFRDLAEDIKSGNNNYTSVKALHKLYEEKTGKSSNVHKYYVLRRNQPSNTIPAHLFKDGLRHIHPDPNQSRSITVREAARLQTFGDDFIFLGSMGDQYKMIGNAVPPLFAKLLGYSIYDFLNKYFKEV